MSVDAAIAMIKKIFEAVVGWCISAIDRFNRAIDAFNQGARDIAIGVAAGAVCHMVAQAGLVL